MLTNLPEDETVLYHPIVFFDQGTYFFETRRRLDGAALLRCGQAGLNGAGAGGPIIVMDPIAPLRPLDATCTPERTGLAVRCPGLTRGSWGLLALLGPAEMQRVRTAAGELPGKLGGFSDEEWLLRHAFADERVRENSLLAATLARLPMVFARGAEGAIQFQVPSTSLDERGLDIGRHWVVVMDTGA